MTLLMTKNMTTVTTITMATDESSWYSECWLRMLRTWPRHDEREEGRVGRTHRGREKGGRKRERETTGKDIGQGALGKRYKAVGVDNNQCNERDEAQRRHTAGKEEGRFSAVPRPRARQFSLRPHACTPPSLPLPPPSLPATSSSNISRSTPCLAHMHEPSTPLAAPGSARGT
jgi:hypothetical protein